jgi:hypothetical protein
MKVMALLKENNITVMDWPGNSSDLVPIENVWSIMKAKLKRDLSSISSLPLLIRVIKMMWVKDLSVTLFKKLAHSMPKRIRMCIENTLPPTEICVTHIETVQNQCCRHNRMAFWT